MHIPPISFSTRCLLRELLGRRSICPEALSVHGRKKSSNFSWMLNQGYVVAQAPGCDECTRNHFQLSKQGYEFALRLAVYGPACLSTNDLCVLNALLALQKKAHALTVGSCMRELHNNNHPFTRREIATAINHLRSARIAQRSPSVKGKVRCRIVYRLSPGAQRQYNASANELLDFTKAACRN